MKILLLSNYFPSSQEPVRGTFNLQQARALSQYCELQVVAPVQWFPIALWHGAGPTTVPYREQIEELPTWHPRYALTPGVARDTYALQMAARLIPQLSQVRREFPFDILFATWAFPDVVVGALAARLFGVPLLAKVHGSDVNVQTRYRWRRHQIRWAMGQAHRVLAVSHALRRRLGEIGVPEEKIMVHHNGVDRDRFYPADRHKARRELGLKAKGKHVVFVGYLVEAKSLPTLLEAVARLRVAGSLDFTTHIVGCGPLENELRHLAEQLHLRSAVLFHGRRSHAEVPRWMAAADVFCLPSIREGCPNVILEALCCGRPVVATEVGGIPELTTPENAVLVPPGNAEALASALRQAMDRDWDPEVVLQSVSACDWDRNASVIYRAAREATGRF